MQATPPDYARRNPLEIGVQLRNLVNRGDFLTVQYPGGQLVTRLLEVDVGARTFTFDWGALAEQNASILGASHCTPRPRRRACASNSPRHAARDALRGLPAFVADFPDVLMCIQRREYFRVDAPIVDPFLCRGKLPDGESFLFEVHNLSLGGGAAHGRRARRGARGRHAAARRRRADRPRQAVARPAARVAAFDADAERVAALPARLPLHVAAGQRGEHAAAADHAARDEAPCSRGPDAQAAAGPPGGPHGVCGTLGRTPERRRARASRVHFSSIFRSAAVIPGVTQPGGRDARPAHQDRACPTHS